MAIEEVAVIGVAVETSGIEKGKRSLEDLAGTGAKVEASMAKIGSATSGAAKGANDVGVAASKASGGMDELAKSSEAAASAQKKAGDSAQSSSASFVTLGNAVKAIALGATIQQYIQFADAASNVRSRLALVTSSAAELASVQSQLFSIAQGSRVGFDGLADTYAQIARASKDLGVSQGQLLGVTKTISQALTISGTSAASANAALVQLSQGLASGQLRGEELNSVLEQTPRLAQAIAEGLGKTTGELRAFAQEGKLTSEQVLTALEKSASKVADEFGRITPTVQQAGVTLKNALGNAIGQFDATTGASEALAKGIIAVSSAADDLASIIKNNQPVFAAIGTGLAGAGVVAGLAGVALGIKSIAGASVALGVALSANPLIWPLLGIGAAAAAVSGFAAYNAAQAKTAEGIRRTINELEALNKRGPGIYNRSAEDMEKWGQSIEKRNKQIRELQQQLAVLESGGIDNRAEDSRFARMNAERAKADADAKRTAEELATVRQRLSGIDATYVKNMEQIVSLNQRGVLVGDEYTRALKTQQDILLKKSATSTQANKALEDEAKLMLELSGLTGSFSKDWETLTKAYKTGAISLDQLTESQADLLAKQPAIKANAVAEAKAQEELSKAYKEAAAERLKSAAAAEQSAASLVAQNDAMRDEIELIGLTSAEQTIILQQRNEEVILTKEATLAELERQSAITGTATRTQIALAAEIDALKDRNKLLGAKDVKNAAAEAAKQSATEWQKASDSINQSLTDALLRGFESGKGFAKNLRDTVVNMFKTLVLRPIISAVINPISGAVAGALGLAGNAAAATGGAGALGGIGSAASGLSALTGTFGMGLRAGISGLFGEAGIAGTLSAGTTALGAGNIAGGLGTLAGPLAVLGGGILALTSLMKATKGETRTGGQFGVAFDGSVTNQRRGQTYVIEGQQFDRDFSKGLEKGLKNGITYRLEGDPVAQEDAIRNAVSGTASGINSILKALGSNAALTGFSAGLETSEKGRGGVFAGGILNGDIRFGESGKGDNYAGTLYEKFSTNSPDFKTALENFTLDLKQSTIQALQSVTDIPKTVQDLLKDVDAESLGEDAANNLLETINAQIVAVNSVRESLAPLGGIFSSIAGASFDAQSRLVSLSGGVDKFLQNANQFVSQYYSEVEQSAIAAVQLSSALEKVGLDLTALGVDTKAEFRSLVESIDVNSEAGQEQLAALLSVAPQFADVADSLQKNNLTLEQLANQAPQIEAIEKLLSPQEQTAKATAESAALLGNLVGETAGVASAVSGLAGAIGNSTVTVVVSGQSGSSVTVPKFANGGAFSGGLRLVGEKGPELEFTGPSAIYSTNNSMAMLAKAVEEGFVKGAEKSTLNVKSLDAATAASGKTPIDIFITRFTDLFPQFAERLSQTSIDFFRSNDFFKNLGTMGTRPSEDLINTVLKLIESGWSSSYVNEYLSILPKREDGGVATMTGAYADFYKLRKDWGWTGAQIQTEIAQGSGGAEQILKALYDGVVSQKDLDPISEILAGAANSLGLTQENLAQLFDAGILKDYLVKGENGQYSLKPSEAFVQGGGEGGDGSEEAQRMADLLAEQRQLEIRLLQAQGKQQEATNMIREDAIKGLSEEAIAIYDRNRALEEQIRVQESLNGFAKEAKQLQAQLLELTGDAEGAKEILRALAIEGLTEVEIAAYDANQALRDQIQALNDAKAAAQNALQGIEQAVRAEQARLREEFQKESTVLRDRIKDIGDVINILDSALKSVRSSITDTGIASQTSARLTLQSVLTAVRGGSDISGFRDVIEQASGTLTQNDVNLYGSRADFLRSQVIAAGLLEDLNKAGGKQLTIEEQQLQALEDGLEKQLAALDQIVTNAREQLNAILGIDDKLLSIDAAVQNFDEAIASLKDAIANATKPPVTPPPIADGGGNLPWGWGTPGGSGVGWGGPGTDPNTPIIYGSVNPFQNPMLYSQQPTSNAEVVSELQAVRSVLAEMQFQSMRTADAVNGNPEQPMLVETVV